MIVYNSVDRKSELHNKYKDYTTISLLMKKNNLRIPVEIEVELQEIEKEIKRIDEVYDKFNGAVFYKTFFSKRDNKEVTFKIILSGHFIKYDSGFSFLIGKNPNTDRIHQIRLSSDFCLDTEWLERNRIICESDQPYDFDDEDFYDIMPCDMDPSDCGVTCFNCPRGN